MEVNYLPVHKFYAGKSVLITGGAGFLGKVLLEKLLFSCPEVDKVYLLLRGKKDLSAEQRLSNIIDLPIFSRLKLQRPQDLKKIILLKGDLLEHNLNIRENDLKTITDKVSVVIHAASTVKFNDSLKTALRNNFESTKNLLNVCEQMANLKVFVYISTAYSNFNQTVLEEKVYPLPTSIEEVYKMAEQDKNNSQNLYGRPNTYTFTKAMTEHLVSQIHGKIPVIIIRPSIVTPSKSEPVQGWVDNWYGASGLITMVAKGVCRSVHTSKDHVIDLIPVDYFCNLTLVAAARAKPQPVVEVYNSCSGGSNPIKMSEFVNYFCEESVKNNFNVLSHPSAIIYTKHYWVVRLVTKLTYVVANVTGSTAGLCRYKNKHKDLVSRLKIIHSSLHPFTSRSWLMKTDKSNALHRSLSPADASQFPFLASDINWKEYMRLYFHGVKKYLIEKNF